MRTALARAVTVPGQITAGTASVMTMTTVVSSTVTPTPTAPARRE